MSWQDAALLATWIALLCLAFAVAGLLRAVRAIAQGKDPTRRHAGPRLGQAMPSRLVPGREDGIVLFADSDCGPCGSVIPALEEIEGAGGILVAFRGRAAQLESKIPRHVLVVEDAAVQFEELGVPVTPYALVVVDGLVAAVRPIGSPESLIEFALNSPLSRGRVRAFD